MTIWRNFRFAARQLRKSPAFTITVLLTLALCIGVNTAIYSVVDALLFRPLPYPDPSRLVLVATTFQKGSLSDTDTSQDGAAWETIRDHATLLDSAVYGGDDGVNLFSNGQVAYVQQQRVSANYFKVLGIHPFAGREFTRAEDVTGGPPLVILSYALWQRLFHGDRGLVGHAIDLRGAPYTVVGIMPPGFHTEIPTDLWTPLQPSQSGEGGGRNYTVVGRLKPGVSIAQASGQLNSITYDLGAEARKNGFAFQDRAVPLQTGLTNDLRSQIDLMWGAVALVLFIGCINIAGIMLSRSAARSREMATRLALGAGRGRIVLELLAESVLLSLGGGALGLLVGSLALDGLLHLGPAQFQLWNRPGLDLRTAAVMLSVSLFTSILFGLFPASNLPRSICAPHSPKAAGDPLGARDNGSAKP